MKFSKICVVTILCMCLMVGVVSAADNEQPAHKSINEIIKDWCKSWDGWTFDKSDFQRLTEQWKQDVREKIRNLITERGKSFEDRVKSQAYALGWDDRFDYYDKYGSLNWETGEITYDIPFWDLLFGGLQFREKWFTNIDDYNEAMSVYMENYNNAVQVVPREA